MRTHTHTQHNDSINIKLLILGIAAVGKSSLLLRLTDQQWLPEGEMNPTIGVDTWVMSRNRGRLSRALTFYRSTS
jgi:GTPase SAR1 family protein